MISRRKFVTGAAAALMAPQAFGASSGVSLKKGWSAGSHGIHKTVGAHWYYNWTPAGSEAEIEFVPMIKGGFNVNEKSFKRVRGYQKATALLGYNEPERAKQGNISVEKGIELWPKLVKLAESKNLRLGSPAPSSDTAGLQWLDRFMEKADDEDLRVDFVAVHWYGGTNADQFEVMIDGLYRKYRKPIWVTEFNGWEGSEEEHYDFLEESLKFLEKDRNVERYAYFEPGKGKSHSLFNMDGSLTRMGELYRDAGT
ncbi:MAG: glycosyl hydrolase [Luteolibacter sp.]